MTDINENKSGYRYEKDHKDITGSVMIADEVIAVIAAMAASEIDGVSSVSGNTYEDLNDKQSMRTLSRGVHVEIMDKTVSVQLTLNIGYGYSIPEVTARVQDRVRQSIVNMTGLSVVDININIDDVYFEK